MLKLPYLAAASLLLLTSASAADLQYRVPVKGLVASAPATPIAPPTTPDPSAASCPLPWGGNLASGQSVIAWLSAAPSGGSCMSEPRVCTDGVLSGTYTAISCAPPSLTGLQDFGSYRAWADGSLAASCQAYRMGEEGYAYQGATGSGAYRVLLGGVATDVYCDMTTDGGGWTLAIRAQAGTPVVGYKTVSSFNAVDAPFLTGATFKLRDADINELRSEAYRVDVYGGYTSTRYFSADCQFGVNTQASVSSSCRTSYSNAGLSADIRAGSPGTSACGISDYITSTNSMNIYTVECANSGRNHAWFAGNAQAGSDQYGGDNYQQPTSFRLWVR